MCADLYGSKMESDAKAHGLHCLADLHSLRQSKTEYVASRCDGNILIPVHGVTHRRGMDVLPGVEVPERSTRLRVHGLERLVVVTEEQQAPRGCHRAAA